MFGAQKRDDMVCLHHAHQAVGAVHHRERMQIVLVEELRDFILVGFSMDKR